MFCEDFQFFYHLRARFVVSEFCHCDGVKRQKQSHCKYCYVHVKILFQKIFVRISFLKRFIEVEALLGLSKALIRFI